MPESITLLAIETSCDETGVAVVRKTGETIEVLSEAVASQVDIHALTKGVVPEVAAREHVAVIRPLIHDVLTKSGVKPDELSGIAITVGPGLQPALAVGVTAARTLSLAWNKPLVPVHHLEGHIYSALLAPHPNPLLGKGEGAEGIFPALALIVSGGHTMLINITGHLQYEVIGSTRDDAAGEAFDKVARLLDLPYPGGPALSKLAQQGRRDAFNFPRPMLNSGDLDFSFSGLKTAVLYALRDIPEDKRAAAKANIAASFEQAVVDTLVIKTKQAIAIHRPAVILLAGGVAANALLREQLQELADTTGVPLRIAPLKLCGDNATMIGQVGVFAYEQDRQLSWTEIDAFARLNISDFKSPSEVRRVFTSTGVGLTFSRIVSSNDRRN